MPGWIPDTESDERAMLAAIGHAEFDELFADIPAKVRLRRMGIAEGLTEPEVVGAIDAILEKNRPYSELTHFLGGRIGIRYLPAAVDAILSRSEFYTSYTPYQPEASQGMLQSLFEFQSLWVELTGLDAANASLYDGATAAGEAMLLCRRIREGDRFLVPASLPWEEKSVLANYAAGHPIRIDEVPYDPERGTLDLAAFRAEVARGGVFGALVDVPNGFGILDEGWLELRSILGEIPLVATADPLALSVVEPPGSWGADIVVGEGQGFGLPPSFGGPLLGLFACKREHLRYAPGRIVGATRDVNGRRAFALTLQTREQHIRRSRATSNICTNESLLALAFVVYASVVGPTGLAALQTRIADQAGELAKGLSGIEGLRAPRFSGPFLSGFTAEVAGMTAPEYLSRLASKKVLGGIPLGDPRPHGAPAERHRFLISAHEGTDAKAIAKFASAARALSGGSA